MAAVGLITLGFIGTYIYLMRQAGRDVWFFYVFVAPFLLVGGLLAFFGLRKMLSLARFGSWEIDVPAQGGVLGQPLEVTLFPARERVPTGPLTCQLRCIRISRNRARGHVNTLWTTSWTTSTALIHPLIGLRLMLPLPDDGEATNIDRCTGSGVQWQLNVLIPSEAMSEEPVFDLPVRIQPPPPPTRARHGHPSAAARVPG